MSWLRRFSRDRSSKVEDDFHTTSRPFSHSVDSPTIGHGYNSNGFDSQDRLQNHRPSTAGEAGYVSIPAPSKRTQTAGGGGGGATTSKDEDAMNRSAFEPTPDPLTKAFNEALRPYQDQLEDLKEQLEEKSYQIEKLEDERADMHAWIDKRGLRAGENLFTSSPFTVP